MFHKGCTASPVSIINCCFNSMIKSVTNYGRGATKREGGSEFYPYKKKEGGGVETSFSHMEGGGGTKSLHPLKVGDAKSFSLS